MILIQHKTKFITVEEHSSKIINSEFDDPLVSDRWSLDCSTGVIVFLFSSKIRRQEHHSVFGENELSLIQFRRQGKKM